MFRTTRRNLLRTTSGGLTLAVLATGLGSPRSALAAQAISSGRRQHSAYALRRDTAAAYLQQPMPAPVTKSDEDRYADKSASFAKTLAHNDLGEPDPLNFGQLVDTLMGRASSPGMRATGEISQKRALELRDRLSPQEMQIATLAAEGLSNREVGRAAVSVTPDGRLAPVPAVSKTCHHVARATCGCPRSSVKALEETSWRQAPRPLSASLSGS
jgi:hypothetical protein